VGKALVGLKTLGWRGVEKIGEASRFHVAGDGSGKGDEGDASRACLYQPYEVRECKIVIERVLKSRVLLLAARFRNAMPGL
jgi:hypothetical protein